MSALNTTLIFLVRLELQLCYDTAEFHVPMYNLKKKDKIISNPQKMLHVNHGLLVKVQ